MVVLVAVIRGVLRQGSRGRLSDKAMDPVNCEKELGDAETIILPVVGPKNLRKIAK